MQGSSTYPPRPPRSSSIVFRTPDPRTLAQVLEHRGWRQRYTRHITEHSRWRFGPDVAVVYRSGLVLALGDAAGVLALLAAAYPLTLQQSEVQA